jgi:Ser/Thr protein kinase RdoA (MazF antagonist)
MFGADQNPIPPAAVLARWRRFADARVRPITAGLINSTFALQVGSGEKAVLQRLHPVFSPEVNLDIAAITAHLAARGLLTPRLLPTDAGDLWVMADDRVWRAMSWIDGVAHPYLRDGAMAEQAGALVGRFHGALADLDHRYRAGRAHVHDTAAHLGRLREALERHAGHRLYPAVAALASPLLRDSAGLLDFGRLPQRHAHGDLKISNLMFDRQGRGLALIDLDTLAPMHWPLEMGDALRSWCNPRREDQLPARLDLALLYRAMAGYRRAAGDLVTAQEWEALIPGLARICLELSARFLADALNESYFGWEAGAYGTRGEHNLARGRAMWELYRDVRRQAGEAQRHLQRI